MVGVEAEYVGRVGDQTLTEEQVNRSIPHVLDVHSAPAGEVEQPFSDSGRALKPTGAPGHRLALQAHDRVVTERALLGHGPLLLFARASRDDRADHFGDHVTGTANDYLIADSQVLESNLILVVQRRHAHGCSADKHRLENRKRGGCPGTANVDRDVLESRHLFLGWELVGDRPSRGLRRKAEFGLIDQRIGLDYDAIGLIGHVVTVPLGLLHELEHFVDGVHRQTRRVGAKAE